MEHHVVFLKDIIHDSNEKRPMQTLPEIRIKPVCAATSSLGCAFLTLCGKKSEKANDRLLQSRFDRLKARTLQMRNICIELLEFTLRNEVISVFLTDWHQTWTIVGPIRKWTTEFSCLFWSHCNILFQVEGSCQFNTIWLKRKLLKICFPWSIFDSDLTDKLFLWLKVYSIGQHHTHCLILFPL